MTGTEQLLAVARAYSVAEGIDLSTTSWRALGDSKKLTAIENGADIQVGRFERTLIWFSQNWPPNIEWPAGIARPATAVAAPQPAEAAE
jgi:hypothetical protein